MKNIGIRTRSRIEADRTTTDMGSDAASEALRRAGILADSIDFIICATNSQDHLYPSTASKIQQKLGATHATSLDIQAGCTGWLFGMRLAVSLALSGQASKILVIGSDALSRALNFKDRSTTLFGDGSGAAVVESRAENETVSAVPAGKKTLPSPIFSTGTAPSLAMQQETIYQEKFNRLEDYFDGKDMITAQRPLPLMEGKVSLKLALTKSKESLDAVIQAATAFGIHKTDIDLYVPHQTNVHVIKSLCEHVGFPFVKIPYTLEKYGGISTAGLPTAMNEHYTKGLLKKGDLVLCSGYGAGFTYGAMMFTWEVADSGEKKL